jgi:hypothetical protein
MISQCCLFIDADPYNQALFNSALHEISPETICFNAATPSEAMYMINSEGIQPSYVFIEFNAQEHESLDFLVNARRIPDMRNTPIIVHATSPPAHYILKLKESGASAIYYKPYKYADVLSMLTLYFSSAPAGMHPN